VDGVWGAPAQAFEIVEIPDNPRTFFQSVHFDVAAAGESGDTPRFQALARAVVQAAGIGGRMATKLRAQALTSGGAAKVGGGQAPTFEEIFVRNDAVSLCLLVNRRSRMMRVIDFRAGASPAKKVMVQSIARRERVDKVVVLVERDECATWARLGFVREGNVPGFYKRSDAFIMGYVVPPPTAPAPSVAKASRPGVRPAAESGVFSVGRHTLYAQDEEPELEDEAPAPAPNAVVEKTITHARKHGKELATQPTPSVKIAPLAPADVQKRIALATKEGRALTGFETFGRDVTRDDVVVTTKGLGEIVVGMEIQRCYGNAFVEVLTGPRDDRERAFLCSAIRAVCERLLANEIVCAFALTPGTDVKMAAAYVANGFRRTGILRQHLRSAKGDRVDAILWSRKLAVPGEEE
jgi:hypothetical protein